jgi:hypothetical protein
MSLEGDMKGACAEALKAYVDSCAAHVDDIDFACGFAAGVQWVWGRIFPELPATKQYPKWELRNRL